MSKRLETEVWALDRCCGCGDCIALCSKGVLHNGPEAPILEKRQKNLGLSHTTLDTCTFCPRFCEMGCPRMEEEWPALEPWRVVSARTRPIGAIMAGGVPSGEPGDVIKRLLVAAMAAGLVDGAIVSDVDPWTLQPQLKVATTVGEVVDTLGTPYLWAPTLTAMNEAVYELGLQALAVVGTPCVSQGLRKLRAADNSRLDPYKKALRLSIAEFCTGVYKPDLTIDALVEKMGIGRHAVKRLEASPREGLLTAVLWDGTTRTLPLSEVEGLMRLGCARCDDYVGESADIAVGTVGAKEGYTTLIVRSQAGDTCLRAALNMGLLEVSDEVDLAALNMASREKDRRQRAQAFDKLTMMMLDALAEPLKRAEVKKAFIRLYDKSEGKSARALLEEENCNVTCGQC